MIRSGVRILVIVVIAAVIGVGYGHYRHVPLLPDVQQIKQQRDARAIWAEKTAINLDDFVRHYQSGKLVIDARDPETFAEGHLDAPLIMNIQAEEADRHLERALSFIGSPIVLYCSSEDCESSETLWNAMRNWAFPESSLRVFHPGWAGIQAAKLPTAKGPDTFVDSVPDQDDTQSSAVTPGQTTTSGDADNGGDDASNAEEEGNNP